MRNNLLIFSLLIIAVKSVNAQTADFNFTPSEGTLCTPHTVSFTQVCTGTPIGFVWNFGNNQRGVGANETCTYSSAGTYYVTLTALYASNAIAITKSITIHPRPEITLSANKDFLCKPGTIEFSATGSPYITGYEWNFGDGSPVQNTVINTTAHSYTSYGAYTASVKVLTAAGCTDSSSFPVRISKMGISGNMSVTNGCIPAVPDFIVNTDLPPGDAVLNYSWNFGDNSPVNIGESNSISHRYNSTNTIPNAGVTINSVQGCSNQFNFPSFAFGIPPTNTAAKTALAKDTFCGSEIIRFTATAANANAYLWQYGDSGFNTVPDTFVTHKYSDTGRKTLLVTPSFNGCAGSIDSIQIFVKGVIARFVFSNLCSDKKNYHFSNRSRGNVTHFEWEFSDRPGVKDSVIFNTNHIFPATGSFTARLALTDNTTGCTDRLTSDIHTAVPAFSRNINSVCKDSLITYSVSKSYPPNAGYTYEFFVNDSMVNNSGDSILQFTPSRHGSYAEYVVIKDISPRTCSDTIYLSSNTIVKGPVVDFSSPQRLCMDESFNFINSSYPFYPVEEITKWHWDFDDNQEDSVKNPPPHLYSRAAVYTVGLTATDINGCAQRITKNTHAAPLPQIVAFPARDTICGSRDTALLTAYTIDTLLWMPSSNISCNNCDTTNVNPSTSTDYVAQATNRFGCTTYDTCQVTVYQPIQLTISPADTSICPGQPVSYQLNTDGITRWTGSDLSNTTISNPTATPSGNRSYTVTVEDSAGCYSGSAMANVYVYSLPEVNAGDDQVLPYNTPFTIKPIYSLDVGTYQWEPAAGLPCSTCSSIGGIALKSTTYTVKTTSLQGCQASDKITIYVACEKGNLLLPTAFTPNGDGLNEFFYPITRGYRNIKTFVIFNRRGNKVFERQNFAPNIPSLGWNGITRNAETSSSTEAFGWYLEAACEQGETIINKGTVVLVR